MTMFTYILGIPATNNDPSQDQPNMLINNNNIAGIIAVDHIGFNANNGGYHNVVHFSPQSGDPATIATIGQLYTKQVSTDFQLFYESPGGLITQLTNGSFANASTFGKNIAYGTPPAGFTQTGGWTTLPGGLILQYGFFGKTQGLGASAQVQFPITFNHVFTVIPVLYRDSGNQSFALSSVIPVTTTTFNFLTSSSESDGIEWLAIGN